MGNLLEATKLLVAASAGPGYAWGRPVCIPRPASTRSKLGQVSKGPRHPGTTSTYWLPVRLSQLKEPLAVCELPEANLSHQIGMSGVHQVDKDSNSVPVLGLRPLNKSFQGTPRQLLPASGLWTFVVGLGLREMSEFGQ